MKKPPDERVDTGDLWEKIIGLGETSSKKSYYPELRKKLEDLERYKQLLDQSNDAIFLIDVPSGAFLNVSKSACRQMGCSGGGRSPKTIYDLLPENREQLGEIFSGKVESAIFYARLLKPAGEEGHYEVNMRRVRLGDHTYVVAVARDITERWQAEAELQAGEERIRRMLDSSPIPMTLYDAAGNVFYLNKKFTQVYGYTLKDLPSLSCWWPLAYPDPDYRKMVMNAWEDCVAKAAHSSGEIEPMETIVTCKNGSSRHVEFYGTAIGEPRLAILQDITERKRVENDLLDAKAQAELYLDLMSHDITNMNQALMGYLEMLEISFASREIDQGLIYNSLEIINRSSKLIDEVKKLTMVQAGKAPLKEVDVCVILSAVKARHSDAQGRPVTINFTPGQDCTVVADENLRDVLDNLVENAVRHSTGPVTIDLAVETVSIAGRAWYQITVADTGPGIPDDLKKKVFLSLKELGEKAVRRGFGLYLVRTLVDHYRGRVWVEDRVQGDYSQGSKFIVQLPSPQTRDSQA